MSLPDGTAPNPFDYWTDPARLRKGLMVFDSLQQYHPVFVTSLARVADGFLSQELVVPVEDIFVEDPPVRLSNFGLTSVADAVGIVVNQLVKDRTGNARYVAPVSGARFEEPGRPSTHYGTLACGMVADPRDPAEYVPVVLSGHANAVKPYRMWWLPRYRMEKRLPDRCRLAGNEAEVGAVSRRLGRRRTLLGRANAEDVPAGASLLFFSLLC